jgi:hypothetical protein
MARRAGVVLALAVLVAAPAAVLRGMCAGRSCAAATTARADVPYCSLPAPLRAGIRDGFYEGRSPEVLAVARRHVVGPGGRWPSVAPGTIEAGRVPVVLAGRGVRRGVALRPGIGLDDIAPTLADIIGLRRPHPEVRSGRAHAGVASGARPRLVLEVVWEGVSSSRLEHHAGAWPFLAALTEGGAATLRAESGSLPLDPAALAATIGTGGLPRDHGITGSRLRNESGRLVWAWGPAAPTSVIATLADDLDRATKGAARIGVVAPERYGVGLIGGNWYLDGNRDDIVLGRRSGVAAARRLLGGGYGRDRVTDLLAVAMRGPLREMDRGLGRLVEAARRAAGGSVTVAVTATGGAGPALTATSAAHLVGQLERRVPGPGAVVETAAAGGLFLDQRALARRALAEDEVVASLRSLRAPAGERLLADAFSALAVTFGRYC